MHSVRILFESQAKEFYGGNNLQRDGDGYDSSYVNMKWEMFRDVYKAITEQKMVEGESSIVRPKAVYDGLKEIE
jgi:hypothetical protein